MVLKYNKPDAAEATKQLLLAIGVNVDSEHLKDTPNRVAKAWQEWTKGYHEEPKAILKTFSRKETDGESWVIVHNIPIVSTCCHHLAPIKGYAHIGYVPNKKLVGLSKLARIAEVYMRRLQIQEALTDEIAKCLFDNLEPMAVGVYITAGHGCMDSRGVNIHGTTTTTHQFIRSNDISADGANVMVQDFWTMVKLNHK